MQVHVVGVKEVGCEDANRDTVPYRDIMRLDFNYMILTSPGFKGLWISFLRTLKTYIYNTYNTYI